MHAAVGGALKWLGPWVWDDATSGAAPPPARLPADRLVSVGDLARHGDLHLLLDQGALNRHLADDGVYRYERAA